jgi:hypothetical protein
MNINEARRQVEQNRHNGLTTTYYLALKRYLRQGNKSIADITKYNAERIAEILKAEQKIDIAKNSLNSYQT